ncbi:MAG TPA: fibronectin type III domain-containing protein [Candidatus Eisenbacteria bacterium]|nr:fibronectin type III domain-containing protein [Candidatus Eisenbacteria bacterium]
MTRQLVTDIGPRRTSRSPLQAALAALALILGLIVPSTAHAQTSADSTVLLMWTAPGDDGNTGTATTYALRYRTTPPSTDTLSWWNAATSVSGLPAPRSAGSTDSMRVRSLQPLTTYYFILRAADEVPNWSGFSNVASKTTGGDNTPPSAVADLSVTGATGTTLALRWTAPGDDGTTGTATSYDIRYSTSTITSGNWNSATQASGEPAPAAGGTVQTFTLNGLQSGRTYYVAIRATDNGGNQSSLSNVTNGSTPDTIAPATVQDLSQGPDRFEGLTFLAFYAEERD